MKIESPLKSKLMQDIKAWLPTYVAIRHEDVRRVGVPDLSTTSNARTAWWEFKHGTPDFESNGAQELMMLRLAAHGFARYVIWMEEKDGSKKRTLIVHPKNIGTLDVEDQCRGFSNLFIINYMRAAHARPF